MTLCELYVRYEPPAKAQKYTTANITSLNTSPVVFSHLELSCSFVSFFLDSYCEISYCQ